MKKIFTKHSKSYNLVEAEEKLNKSIVVLFFFNSKHNNNY